jgi:Spy/CpxP family protein refolding chaperone
MSSHVRHFSTATTWMLAGLVAAACGGQAETASPPAAPVASAAASAAPAPPVPAPPAPEPVASAAPAAPPPGPQSAEQAEGDEHRERHHGGVLGLIAMSLHDLQLTPEQESAVEKIRADFIVKAEPAKAAGKDLTSTLADGVAAGSLNRAKDDAAVAKLATQIQALDEAAVAALDRLHGALTAQERSALVSEVQSHWEKWKEAHGEDEKAGDKHRSGHLLALVRRLGLSKDQAEKIKASFHDRAKAAPQDHEHKEVVGFLKDFAASFPGGKFNAKSLKMKAASVHMARWGATRMARFLEAAAPVLTPDQRQKLAEMLRQG